MVTSLVSNTDFTAGSIGTGQLVDWFMYPQSYGSVKPKIVGDYISIPGNSASKTKLLGPSENLIPAVPGDKYQATITAWASTSYSSRRAGIALWPGDNSQDITEISGAYKIITGNRTEYTFDATIPEGATGYVVVGVWAASAVTADTYVAQNSVQLTAAAGEPIEIVPPEAVFETDPDQYTLPATENVDWQVNTSPVEPGTYPVDTTDGDVTVSVLPVARDGYVFNPAAVAQEHTWKPATVPDPDPDPDPGQEWPTVPTELGRVTARWLQLTSEQDILDASFYADVVQSFVMGYTRGRGFNNGEPNSQLKRVIVSGAARLTRNYDSVIRYQADNQSETLTVFSGFNIAEKGILNNFRKRFA